MNYLLLCLTSRNNSSSSIKTNQDSQAHSKFESIQRTQTVPESTCSTGTIENVNTEYIIRDKSLEEEFLNLIGSDNEEKSLKYLNAHHEKFKHITRPLISICAKNKKFELAKILINFEVSLNAFIKMHDKSIYKEFPTLVYLCYLADNERY